MEFQNLLINNRGAVRTITINRPSKLNALNHETISELQVAFDQAREDGSVRVVVRRSSGHWHSRRRSGMKRPTRQLKHWACPGGRCTS